MVHGTRETINFKADNRRELGHSTEKKKRLAWLGKIYTNYSHLCEWYIIMSNYQPVKYLCAKKECQNKFDLKFI